MLNQLVASAPAGGPVAAVGIARILLIEDDDSVRALARRMLSRLGYDVVDAPNGEEARTVAAAGEGSIDLVLSDVVLPGQGARFTVDFLRQRSPRTAALYMSGYTQDALVSQRLLAENAPFIQKPFTAATLDQKIREVLDV